MESKMGYVHAEGTSLHDGDGKKLVLKGVNLGDWFVQEFWMASSCVDGFQTGIYTQSRGIAAMRDNPNLQEGQIRELEAFYTRLGFTPAGRIQQFTRKWETV